VTCRVFAFGPDPTHVYVAEEKGARIAQVIVRFFPESQLGRYAKALETNLSGFPSGDPNFEVVGPAAEDPTTPFNNPPKNGCHKGS